MRKNLKSYMAETGPYTWLTGSFLYRTTTGRTLNSHTYFIHSKRYLGE